MIWKNSLSHMALAAACVIAAGLNPTVPVSAEITYTNTTLKISGDTTTADFGVVVSQMLGLV